MIDLILRNARVAGQDELTDLGVERGKVVAVGAGTTAAEVIDLAGRLVTPPRSSPSGSRGRTSPARCSRASRSGPSGWPA